MKRGARYVPLGRSVVTARMLDRAAVWALCGKLRSQPCWDDQPRNPVLYLTMLVSAPPGSAAYARTPRLASSFVKSMMASLDSPYAAHFEYLRAWQFRSSRWRRLNLYFMLFPDTTCSLILSPSRHVRAK